MKILVCGGRDFDDWPWFCQVMDEVTNVPEDLTIIHGAARGADSFASRYADIHSLHQLPCPAAWDVYGKAAGVIRNQYMLGYYPDVVVAFPGGRGTADMVRRATSAGVKILDLREDRGGY